MRSGFIYAIVRLLPLDARAARAVDETLLDWEHELAGVTTALQRVATNLRGFAAWVSVMGRIAVTDLRGLPSMGLIGRVAVLVLLPSLFVTSRTIQFRLAHTVATRVMLVTLLFPGVFVVLLPIGMFFAIVWQGRSRPAPVLGVVVACMLLSIVGTGFVTPIGNQIFRERVVAMSGRPLAAMVEPGANEWTLGQVVRFALSARENPYRATLATKIGGVRLALVAGAGVWSLLGAAVARTRHRWRWASGFAVAIPLTAIILLWLLAAFPGVTRGYHDVVDAWVLALVPLILLPSARRSELTPPPPSPGAVA